VTCKDARIIPGAVSLAWVNDRREEWGEESALWQAKVRGQFPTQGSDTLIRIEWLESAQSRWVDANRREVQLDDKKGIAAGLDIAERVQSHRVLDHPERSLGDPGGEWKANISLRKDVDQAVELVMDALSEGINIRILSLDDTGLGQGVTATLRKYQREAGSANDVINPVNFGKNCWDDNKFELTKTRCGGTLGGFPRTRLLDTPGQRDRVLGTSFRQLVTGTTDGPDLREHPTGKTCRLRQGWESRSQGEDQGLPTKSPDVAHSFILAVHSWLKLRSDAREPRQRPSRTCSGRRSSR